MVKLHEISERRSPVSVTWECRCGWRHTEKRAQNALARMARLRAAYNAHIRDIRDKSESNLSTILAAG